MKRIILLLATVAFIAACSKQEQNIVDEKPEDPSSEQTSTETPASEPSEIVSEGRVITVNALETKTAITPKENGSYSFTWKKDDYIELYEFVYENLGIDNATPGASFISESLGADTNSASFTVDLNSSLSAPEGAKYRYVAVYPYSDSYYWSSEDKYADLWDDSEEGLPVHPVICMRFSTCQYPKATTFDPDADIIVSKPTVLDARATDNISLNYSRVGAIVKMTLSGLPAGVKVGEGMLSVDADFPLSGIWEYDTERGMVRYNDPNAGQGEVPEGGEVYVPEGEIGQGTVNINISPSDVYADTEGKADIWLRLPEGKIDEILKVSFTLTEYDSATDTYGDQHEYIKEVDLSSSGRSISFFNGKITEFTVGMESAPELMLSYTYTDSEGQEQTSSSTSSYLTINPYFSPDAGTFTIDVDYTGDISEVTVDDTYGDWVKASFDPATKKITLQYEANPDYETQYASSYGIGTRNGSTIIVKAGDLQQNIYCYQYKRDFRNTGETWTGYMTWHGGDDTSEIILNFTPEVTCTDPSISWTIEPFQNSKGLWCTRFIATAQPLEVTDTKVTSDLVISDPLNNSKMLTIRLVRFKKLAPGKYWVVSKGGDSWRSFNIERTFENEEIIVSKTFSLGTSELPEAQVMVTPDSEGLIATPMIFEPIEGSDKYFIYVNLGKDEHGDDIIRYLRKSDQMSHINQFFDSHNHYALVPISGRDSWCEWYVNYVEDIIHVYCDADSGGDQDKVGLLCMGSVTVSENSVTRYRIGCYGASLLNYKGSFDYYGITRHDGMPLYDITLIPYEDIEPLPVAVTAVSVEPSEVALDPGETTTLTATVTPSGAADKSVSWSSGNEAVATVDASGVVTAIKPGEAVITATTTDGSFTSSCTVTVNSIPVTGVTLDKTEVELKVGNTLFLTATVTPSTATNADVTFTIASGSDVIEMVEGSGTATSQAFTAIKTGEAYITVTTQDGGYQANCHVTVYDDVKVSSIVLSPDNVTLDPGESVVYYESGLSYPNTYSVLPGNAANRVPAVSSSDQSVVTAFGDYNFLKGYVYTISAVAPGQTTVTFEAQDGSGVSATLTVTVNEIKNVESISLSMAEVSLYEGEEVVLTPQFTPSDATNQQVNWSSSDNNVATVSGGQVTAVSSGTATITATSADGGHTATCTVTVKEVALETSGAVDMGLHSGLLWAPTNYGATTPDGYGTFFTWAGISLSDGWQTPTKAQYEELIAGCQIHSVRYSNVPGLLFVSNTNQHCLFFPKAGFTYSGTSQGSGYYIVLWTATEISDTMVYQFVYDGQTAQLRSGEKALFTAPVRCVKQL